MANPFMRAAEPQERTPPPPYNTLRAMSAAATRINVAIKEDVERLRRRGSAMVWQEEAWQYHDAIGEIAYAFGLVGNVTSRCRLYAATVTNPADAPTPIQDADSAPETNLAEGLAEASNRAMDRLKSAYGGMPGLLRDAAINLSVAGEAYLVQIPARPGSGLPESWDIRSTDEVRVGTGGKVQVFPRRDTKTNEAIDLPEHAFLGRLWRPHPRYSEEPISSMLGVLDPCAEMLLVNKTFRATARSRLNAGLLYVPDGLSVASNQATDPESSDEPGPEAFGDEEDDGIEEQLVEAMITPISDEESAAAVVPLLLRGPSEAGAELKLLKFERSFDPALATRAEKLLERVMSGLDVPKDLITGFKSVRYSNAVAVDEGLYKAHIEPMLLLICDALTVIYLRPSLIAEGFTPEDAAKAVVWYDPSEVVTHPDRAQAANDGYDRNALSEAAWRRAHGFTDQDAPSPEELVIRIALARGTLSPDLTEALLRSNAPQLFAQVTQQQAQATGNALPPEVQQAIGGPAPATPGPQPGAPNAGRPPQTTPLPAPNTQAPPSPNGSQPPLPVAAAATNDDTRREKNPAGAR